MQKNDGLFSSQIALQSFVKLVQRQLDCGICVGVISEDSLAVEQTAHLHNFYFVPDRVALFGSQPIPITARFESRDAMGKAMVGLAEMFQQHILQVAASRKSGFLIDDPKEVQELPRLLEAIGLITEKDEPPPSQLHKAGGASKVKQ